MAQKLTAVTVRNLRPQEAKYEVMDAENPGFGVWVYPSGKKAFVGHLEKLAGRAAAG